MLGLVVLRPGVLVGRRASGDAEDAADGFAGLLWAPLAAGIALLVNIPIRGFVERPRPFVDHQGSRCSSPGKADYSFVSDHATLAMALAVGIFMVHRRFGLVGIGLAFLEGFCRVYMGRALSRPTWSAASPSVRPSRFCSRRCDGAADAPGACRWELAPRAVAHRRRADRTGRWRFRTAGGG